MRIDIGNGLNITTGRVKEYGLGYEVMKEAYGFNERWSSAHDLTCFLRRKKDKIMLLGFGNPGNVKLRLMYGRLFLDRLAEKNGTSSVVVGYGLPKVGDKKAFVIADGGTVTSSSGQGIMEQMLKHLELLVATKDYTHLTYFGDSQYLLNRGFENFQGLLAREIEPLTEEERRFMEQDFSLDDLVIPMKDE